MRYCPTCSRCFEDVVDTCDADAALTVDVVPGGRILDGKYELVRLLGQGGMGAVFEALQRGIERRAAVKLIKPSYVAGDDALERFRREALACGRIKHPNAITVYDFGVTSEGVAYLAMEYLSGFSLRETLRSSGPVGLRRTVELLGPICAALEAAHRQGVVHRDLKPDNIFLEELEDGTVAPKVLDFGIAKLRTDVEDPRLTGRGVIGTPAYISPEQARGLELDPRSDIYSLGCVVYEMLTGRVPFEAPTPLAVIARHLTDQPAPPSSLNPRIPAAVEAVVLQALEKEPDLRFPSALAFGQAFAAAIDASAAAAPAAADGLNSAVLLARRFATKVVDNVASANLRLVAFPCGIAPDVPAPVAAAALAEAGPELAAAVRQGVAGYVVFEAARLWAERRLSPAGLVHVDPNGAPPSEAPVEDAGLALFCSQPGLSWAARTRSGAEHPLLLAPAGAGARLTETVEDVACYSVRGVPGGASVQLVARLGTAVAWTGQLALLKAGASIVVCAPEASVPARPQELAHLFGSVELRCNEPDAAVSVDGAREPAAVTGPDGAVVLFHVLPGHRRLSLAKEFYVGVEAAVDVQPGERASVDAHLEREKGVLVIASSTPGALIELSGPAPSTESRTLDPDCPLELPAGLYHLRATSPGFVEWTSPVTLRAPGAHVEVALRPVLCPVCGAPAGVEVFACESCRRESIHTGHRHDSGVCLPCAAARAFESARADGTPDAWRAFLGEFRAADAGMAARAEAELRRIEDVERAREIAERASVFASLASRGAIGDVVASWERVASERPGDVDARLALGMALEAAGDPPQALEAYRAAAGLSPEDPFAHYALGRLLARLGEDAEAARALTVVIRRRPDFAEGHAALAGALARLGRLDDAIEGFRIACSCRPESVAYREAWGRALFDRGRFREAVETLESAARGYRQAGDAARAEDLERLAREAAERTVLGKAGKFFKGLFDR